MSTYTKFIFKAPKLVERFKEIGINISTSNGIFTEASEIRLPSGESACVFDEDAWGKTLFGPQEMNLPRFLCGFDPKNSISLWLINRLTDVGEKSGYDDDEEYYDEEEIYDEGGDNGTAFCQETKELIEKEYPDATAKKNIIKLDDFVEEASILFFNYWGGTDFEYTYAEIKNGELYYYCGSGEEEYEVYEDWYWRNLDEFIALIKENISAELYKRKSGKWAKIKK